MAVSVGDGAIRVLNVAEQDDVEEEVEEEDGDKLEITRVYWQGVQGKVLTLAWHPVQENLLAFATAEARVSLISFLSPLL